MDRKRKLQKKCLWNGIQTAIGRDDKLNLHQFLIIILYLNKQGMVEKNARFFSGFAKKYTTKKVVEHLGKN